MSEPTPLHLKFSLLSEPDMFTFSDFPVGVMQVLSIQDSIYDPYPIMTFHMSDENCIFSEQYFYTQSLDFKLKLSDYVNKDSNFDHNFYLNNQYIPQVTNGQFVMGQTVFSLHSSFRKQDFPKSKSYKGNIHSIVSSIINKFQHVNGSPKTYITSTSNFDTWYQSNEGDFDFIEKLSKYALSPQHSDSPFYTFFNLKGEFYFQSVADLFSQSPVDTYYYGTNSRNTQSDVILNQGNRNVISNLSTTHLSSVDMLDQYKIKFYKLSSSGQYSEKDIDIKTKISQNKLFNNKLAIRKEELEQVRNIQRYGLIDNDSQENHYKGWLNYQFVNSTSFPYRITCSTLFDTRLCAGKVITLKFKSPIVDKNNESNEYSGNYLILKSTHNFNEQGLGSTNLLLGKSSINVFKKHKMYSDLI